jgi:hypothetical protein
MPSARCRPEDMTEMGMKVLEQRRLSRKLAE